MAVQSLFNLTTITSTAAGVLSAVKPLAESTANRISQMVAKHGLFSVATNLYFAAACISFSITGARMTLHSARCLLENNRDKKRALADNCNLPAMNAANEGMKRSLLLGSFATVIGLGSAGLAARNLYNMTADS